MVVFGCAALIGGVYQKKLIRKKVRELAKDGSQHGYTGNDMGIVFDK